ncbi:fluoride efflux transporter FluC [Bifidobacterium parmae]|uniref:Fluoride-specific ion channel FluC n=1 Tax=Bifidobacterium parmae TaxID=361854 RepID=A0A2N5IWF3_9BIFI|nr:CrcB family protein [Bifidobacterium parmae]PLS26289.1 camphor resistance CrcB protein [Bifidobacterium parmae]
MGHRIPQIHPDILAVVFVGGAIGTALRYAFAQIPSSGDFHTGTLAANLLACFCYAGLTTFLAGSTAFAARFGARGKEYASRGLGMGLCGGLSTMSTLALECFTAIRSGDAGVGVLYLAVTFALGILCAVAGAWAGGRLAASGAVADDDVRKEA